jgi:hypothetical protein
MEESWGRIIMATVSFAFATMALVGWIRNSRKGISITPRLFGIVYRSTNPILFWISWSISVFLMTMILVVAYSFASSVFFGWP